MSNRSLSRSAPAVLATLAAFACGGPAQRHDGDVDPYNGVIDNTYGVPSFTGTNFTAQGALAIQFQPTVPSSSQRSQCTYLDPSGLAVKSNSCYIPQTGFWNGQTISFFNAGVIKPLPFATLPSYVPLHCDTSGMNCVYAPSMADHRSDGGGGWHADVFPHSCTPGSYDPVQDAFPRDVQFSIVDALPTNNLMNSSALPPLGMVAIHSVTGVTGETCNDLKYQSSIGNSAEAGKFGSRRSDKPTGYEVWYIFDPIVPALKAANTGNGAALLPVQVLWFNGLQANYISGGNVPTDADGNLIAMDGIILGTSTAFGDPFASGKIILPYQPGDDGFSALVRLHDYKTSKTGYNAVCPFGSVCTDTAKIKYVSLSNTCPTGQTTECVVVNAFNTALLAASPQ